MSIQKKVELATEAVDSITNILASYYPALSSISLLTFGVRRVAGLIGPDDFIKRVGLLEKKLKKKKISIDRFREEIEELCEHDRYVFLNNIKRILLECTPEVSDIYISLFIEFVMNESERNKYEELCEIVSQLNANDIATLKSIKDYMIYGNRNFYKLNIKKKREKEEENTRKLEENKIIQKENEALEKANSVSKVKKIGKMSNIIFRDRNIVIGDKTVFWKDYMEFQNIEMPEMEYALLCEGMDENNNPTIDFAYTIRSFIKLEQLGLLSLDSIVTLGTMNILNIDRFHISIFGELVLEYI